MDASLPFTEPLTPPADVDPATLTITGEAPRERGYARGQAAAADIARAAAGYSALFTAGQIPPQSQRDAAEASLTALEAWDPRQVEELRGVAAGAAAAGATFDGQPLQLWHVGLVAARTEILTLAVEPTPECSTIAYAAPGRTLGVQTWDWHAEFAGYWHYQQVSPCGETGLSHAGFAEYGMLGKIGLNSAGVGVMLNILKNRDDAAGGVPVHALLVGVLDRARSVEEALDIIDSAHTTSSSVITVVGCDDAVMVEISPHGTSRLRHDSEVVALDSEPIGPGAPAPNSGRFPHGPGGGDRGITASGGFLIHTNHFIAPDQQDGALPLSATSRSEERISLLDERLRGFAATTSAAGGPHPGADDLLTLMCTGDGDAPVCTSADVHAPFGRRTATLVTVAIDPNAGTIRMSPGSPRELFGTDAPGASGPAETARQETFEVR